jgi:hypothetical protein
MYLFLWVQVTLAAGMANDIIEAFLNNAINTNLHIFGKGIIYVICLD